MRPDLKPGVGDLDAIVLWWTIDDIISAELFKKQVKWLSWSPRIDSPFWHSFNTRNLRFI